MPAECRLLPFWDDIPLYEGIRSRKLPLPQQLAFRHYQSQEGRRGEKNGKIVQEEGWVHDTQVLCFGIPQRPLLPLGILTGVLESRLWIGGGMADVWHCAVTTAIACGLSTDQKV